MWRWCGVLISLQYYIKRESSALAAADGSPLHCSFSWHKLCRIPLELGDTAETWTVDTQWRPAREWVESCWRLGHLLETERGPGDWVETCHVHEQASHCGAVVAAWSWQRASPGQPRPAHRRLSIENYLIHDVSCLPTSASALSQGTNMSTFYFLVHILSFITISILLWEFSNNYIYIDTF